MIHRVKLILFCFLGPVMFLRANGNDTLDRQAYHKNFIGIEVLGTNYFSAYSLHFSPASLEYSRLIVKPKVCFQLGIGAGVFNCGSASSNKLGMEFPVFGLMRLHYRRNGFWIGAAVTAGLGKQVYTVYDGNHHWEERAINFDLQVIPNVCYQLQTKNQRFFCRFSIAPKLNLRAIDRPDYPLWLTLFGFTGGIVI